jgi:uncharacterized integral membrane protein
MTTPASQPDRTDTPNFWVGPLLTFVVLLVPALILVFSNTDSRTLHFAGLEWTAPLWMILLATFVAGMIVAQVFGWLWGVFRRRRARVRAGVTGASGAAS